MSAHPDDIRPGEVAVDLPGDFDAGLYFVGRIRTPWRRRQDCPKNANEALAAGIVCTIEVDPRYVRALTGIDAFTHLLVLYWMHQARRNLVIQNARHIGMPRGTFALRSPVRPNPIAASVVELKQVDGPRLTVVGLDCLDGTPLLDLKPHYATAGSTARPVVVGHGQRPV